MSECRVNLWTVVVARHLGAWLDRPARSKMLSYFEEACGQRSCECWG